jgi:hypothetical protein
MPIIHTHTEMPVNTHTYTGIYITWLQRSQTHTHCTESSGETEGEIIIRIITLDNAHTVCVEYNTM